MTYDIPDKNVEYISNARYLYVIKDRYAYLYGGKGQTCTREVFDALVRAEPTYFAKYSKDQLESIFKYCEGKKVVDCSGFINLITGDYNYSTGYINECKGLTTPAKGADGNLLYTTFKGTGRHIGLDIGHGFFIHCPREMCTFEIGVIDEYPWETSGTYKGEIL